MNAEDYWVRGHFRFPKNEKKNRQIKIINNNYYPLLFF